MGANWTRHLLIAFHVNAAYTKHVRDVIARMVAVVTYPAMDLNSRHRMMTSPKIEEVLVIDGTTLSKISRVLAGNGLLNYTPSSAKHVEEAAARTVHFLSVNVMRSILLLVNGEGKATAGEGLYQSSVVPTDFRQIGTTDPTKLSLIMKLVMSIEYARSATMRGMTEITRHTTGRTPCFSLMLLDR